MSTLSAILRDAEDGRGGRQLVFQCPGCGSRHGVPIGEGPGPRWGWNGDTEKPTFTPSVLVRSGHYSVNYREGEACWCTYNARNPDNPGRFSCGICHSFVTDGQIQFLSDCTHALAGQTVPLPSIN